MVEFIPGAVVVASVIAVMGALSMLARSLRRRGTAGPAIAAAMAAYDEAMHSTAHDTFVEVQAQKDRAIPIPGQPGRRTR